VGEHPLQRSLQDGFVNFAPNGDMVTADQVVGVMDTRDLDAQLKKFEALAEQAQRAIAEAHANVDQPKSGS
jgi:multidrug efflux pump subunit AcrA (membrane-fusion protein)